MTIVYRDAHVRTPALRYFEKVSFWSRYERLPPSAMTLPEGAVPALYRLWEPGRTDELVGYLSVMPEHVYSGAGPWWNTRWMNPRLCLEWLVVYGKFDTYEIWPNGAASYGQDDGFPIEDPDDFADLARGRFLLRGVVFTAERVRPQIEPAAWREHYEFAEQIAHRNYRFKDAR